MSGYSLLYQLYEQRLLRQLDGQPRPRHIGVILDGNRRWAASIGALPETGHQRGANKVDEFLNWAAAYGIELVTLWMLSTDNLQREASELDRLLNIICDTIEHLAQCWPIRMVGNMGMLPEAVKERLLAAERAAARHDGGGVTPKVNIAVGYGGRQEIVDAVKELLYSANTEGRSLVEVADSLKISDITEHLYTRGQPDPDLVIRTSGEQRLSGFLLWQSAHSEYYFTDVYWPDFRRVDFLRALRSYAQRERRMGR